MSDQHATDDGQSTRRDFLTTSALGTCCLALGAATAGIVRLPKPGVVPGANRRVKIGTAEDYPVDTITKRDEQSLFVFRDRAGIYAISAVCTHLGCLVTHEEAAGFDCPCHGSTFDSDGRVTAGPAPKPLPWLELTVAPSGHLVVDLDKVVSVGTKLAV